MAPKTARQPTKRAPLARDVIVATALRLADEHGIESLSMRRLADALGVQAMSLYHHVENREALVDAMVDEVFSQIELPRAGAAWRTALEARTRSARQVLLRHRWATPLMDSRSQPGPATLGHHDAVLGCLRGGGFSVAGAAHAFAVLDAYLYGFLLQEKALPFQTPDEKEALTASLRELMGTTYPHLSEMLIDHVATSGYAYEDEFELGMRLILDGLEQRLTDTHDSWRDERWRDER
jgi:AcrR family transcriptional regulator